MGCRVSQIREIGQLTTQDENENQGQDINYEEKQQLLNKQQEIDDLKEKLISLEQRLKSTECVLQTKAKNIQQKNIECQQLQYNFDITIQNYNDLNKTNIKLEETLIKMDYSIQEKEQLNTKLYQQIYNQQQQLDLLNKKLKDFELNQNNTMRQNKIKLYFKSFSNQNNRFNHKYSNQNFSQVQPVTMLHENCKSEVYLTNQLYIICNTPYCYGWNISIENAYFNYQNKFVKERNDLLLDPQKSNYENLNFNQITDIVHLSLQQSNLSQQEQLKFSSIIFNCDYFQKSIKKK